MLFLAVPAVAGAQVIPSNPFNTNTYDGSIHENPTYDYLVGACNGDTDNAMTFSAGGVPVTDYPAILQGTGETNTNGCNEGSTIDGLLLDGTTGSTTDGDNSGVKGSWTVAAPTGTTITGLQYSDPTFEVASGGGLVAGWFGEVAGDSDGQGVAADHDPTQSYASFHDEVVPAYDCVTESVSGSCTVRNNDTETFVFNTNPWTTTSGSDPALQKVALGFECRASGCYYEPTTYSGVGSALFQVDDPAGAPAAGASSDGSASFDGQGVSGSTGWLTASQLGATAFTTGQDPGGICSLEVGLYKADGSQADVSSDGQLATPKIDPSTGYYTSTEPCSDADSAASYTYTPDAAAVSDLPSGTYYLNAVAQNPAEYQQGSYSWYDGGLGSSPTEAPQQGIPVEIDNTAPTISITGAAGGWTSSAQTFTVTGSTGPSGIAQFSCTDGGTTIPPTSTSDSTQSDINTYTVSSNGAHAIACDVISGVGTSAIDDVTVQIDSQQPTVGFADTASASLAGWYSSAQSVSANSSESDALSGVKSIACSVDGGSPLVSSSGAEALRIAGDGTHKISCTATTNAGVTSAAQTDTVKIDTETPTVKITGAASGSYASGSATLDVSASETGPSGIAEIECDQDNGTYTPVVLSGDDGTFELTGATGSHTADCYAVTNAGVSSSASPATDTVQFDDGDGGSGTVTKYGSSPLIDGGADPYSDGPSQTTWSRSAQQVTVTADKASGAAISSITCTGAGVHATYPNTGSTGKETTTVNVQPPGGMLTCTAADTANNTYPLGSYQFLIDDTPPSGYFVGQDSSNLALVRLAAADAGSGVSKVELTFTCQSGPCLTANNGAPFPIQSEPAALNSDSGYWEADIPDTGAWPDGDYSLTASMTDAAANVGSTGAFADSTTAGISLPARVVTTLTASVTGEGQTADAVTNAETPGATQTIPSGQNSNAARRGEPGSVGALAGGGVAPAAVKVCSVEVKTVRKAAHGLLPGTILDRRCSQTSKRDRSALTLGYGASSTLHGRLLDRSGNTPIENATVVIYRRITTGTALRKLGTAVTNRFGKFSYHLNAGASRRVVVAYDGTPIMHPAAGHVLERFRGRVRIKLRGRAVAGHELLIRGRVEGGHLPAKGVLVQPRYRVRGLGGGWAPFGTAVDSNASGRFTIRIHLAKIAAGLTYRFDVRVQTQTGYAFLTAVSQTITRKVDRRR